VPNFIVKLAETVVMTTSVIVAADTAEAATQLAVDQCNAGKWDDLDWDYPPCCDPVEAYGDDPATETTHPVTPGKEDEDDEDDDDDDDEPLLLDSDPASPIRSAIVRPLVPGSDTWVVQLVGGGDTVCSEHTGPTAAADAQRACGIVRDYVAFVNGGGGDAAMIQYPEDR